MPSFNEPFFFVLVFFFGASLSSYVHTTSFRLANGLGLLSRSVCEGCGVKVPFYGLVPFFGFFLVSGRCRSCSLRIPFAYPLLELAGGLVSLGIVVKSGFGFDALLAVLVFQCFLFIAVHDFLTKEIFAYSFLLLIGLQSVRLLLMGIDALLDGLLAMAIGAGAFHFVAFFYWSLRGRVGLGEGDVTLLGVIGLCFGSRVLLPVVILSCLSGVVFGTAFLFFRRRPLRDSVPFAPAMVFSAYFHWFFPQWYPAFFQWF